MDRPRDLVRFYGLLDQLVLRIGGPRHLAQCHGRQGWPARGVYLFFELGEVRSDSGTGPRVIRVGTHGLTEGSRSSLWGRLSQHRGTSRTKGGNHRGSIFRLLVGAALQANGDVASCGSWGRKATLREAAHHLSQSAEDIKGGEFPIEMAVSAYLAATSFLWIDVPDAPGPQSRRGTIERGAIALLSNLDKPPLDPPSADWLGSRNDRERVRRSGLWNNNHVDEPYDPAFLSILEECIAMTGHSSTA